MTWKDWQNKLHAFEEWRKENHTKSSAQWWAYLFDVFFQQLASLSHSPGLCLDVGCGSGKVLRTVIKQGLYEGIGLDPISESSLKIFKDTIKGRKISGKIELIKAVGEYLPIKNDAIQLCIMAAMLDHVQNVDQTIKEAHRVLGPNGSFLLLECVIHRKHPSFDHDETHLQEFTMEDLKRLLKQFKIEKIRRCFRLPSQFLMLEKLLDSPNIYNILGRMYSVIARYFQNCSTVLIKSTKRDVS